MSSKTFHFTLTAAAGTSSGYQGAMDVGLQASSLVQHTKFTNAFRQVHQWASWSGSRKVTRMFSSGELSKRGNAAPLLSHSFLSRNGFQNAKRSGGNPINVTVMASLPALPSSDRRVCVSCSATGGTGTQAEEEAGEKELLVIGPGVLGTLVAQMWMQEFPGATVIGQTLTTSRHAELAALGMKPTLRDSEGEEETRHPYVIFCAPPSGSHDYAAEVSLAAARWNGEGGLLFTSSSALYDVEGGEVCDESSPSVPLGASPRTDKLLRAEEAVVKAKGCVVRLDRGAHTAWLARGTVDSRPDYLLNLIHYKDAAALCVRALKSGIRSRVFMGCDNHPVTRQDVIDISLRSGKFENTFDKFTGVEGPLGKRMCNDKTRAELEWEPEYKSFAHFMGVE